MSVPEKIWRQYPHAVAFVRFPELPSPRWFQQGMLTAVETVVRSDGIRVHEDLLCLIDGRLPPEGTEVTLILQASIMAVEETAPRNDRKRAGREKAAELHRAQYRAVQDSLQASATDANASLNVPVRWTSGEKTVLSGLSRDSAGDGRNKRSVNHILFLEPLEEGRFKRDANDFLCTSASGSNGSDWTETRATYSMGSGCNYVSRIDCKRCLKLAMRWKNPALRIEPDLVDGSPHLTPSYISAQM